MEKIAEKLDSINKTLENISSTLNKPENKVMMIFKLVGAGVSAFSFLTLIDIIRQWIIGGLYVISFHYIAYNFYSGVNNRFSGS